MEKYKDIMEMSEEELRTYLHSKEHSPKELRKIHKAFAKYGDGIRFESRYPDLPIYISAIALLISVILMFIPVIAQILS